MSRNNGALVPSAPLCPSKFSHLWESPRTFSQTLALPLFHKYTTYTHPAGPLTLYFPSCSAHDRQTSSFWKARMGFLNLVWKVRTHRQPSFWSWPQLSGPLDMRGRPPALRSTAAGKSNTILANGGARQANNVQIWMDLTAQAAHSGGLYRKVGLGQHQCHISTYVRGFMLGVCDKHLNSGLMYDTCTLQI